jgi:hypothetical protein
VPNSDSLAEEFFEGGGGAGEAGVVEVEVGDEA